MSLRGRGKSSRWARWLVISGVSLGLALCPALAHAASKDAEAQQLADEAIFTDYLKLDFKSAEKKLLRAIQLCEKNTCSATVRAQVHRDLAVIYITGLKRQADGKKLLIKALTYDPRIALDADLTTPELVRAFSEAKEEVAQQESGGAPADEAPAADEPEQPVPSAAPERAPAAAAAEEEPKPKEEEPKPEPVRKGSVDCPPDFPGCESVDETPAESDEPASDDKHIRNWLSLNLQQDFLMFGKESGVCTSGPDVLSCFRANDVFRPKNTSTVGTGGEVSGGFGFATTRILLGYERLLTDNITAGARLGYAFRGGPTEPDGAAFLPFHAELRGGYWFGADPFTRRDIRTFVNVAFGLAQVDASVTTEIVDYDPVSDRVARSRVSVWKKTGTIFGGLGVGGMYPLTANGGIVAELRAMLLLPSSGTTVALQAGYAYGF